MPLDPSSMPPAPLGLKTYPEPILRTRAEELASVNDTVRRIAEEMLDIMEDQQGIGLAAPQVGLAWRMFVVDVPPGEGRSTSADPPSATEGPMVFVNPRLKFEGPVEPLEEGCLSLPDIRGEVLRPPIVTVTALDDQGRQFTLRAGGLLARCIQHEADHLDGVLIIDKMTPASRRKNQRAVRDLEEGAV